MILSMTGYAAGGRDLGFALINLELKSVNSRYLDLGFRISEDLRFLEMPLREQISAKVQRGKLEIRGGLQAKAGVGREMVPNQAMVEQLGRMESVVLATLQGAKPLTVADVLRWPGVLADEGLDTDKLQAEALSLLQELLTEFIATRAREGAKLEAVLLDRSTRMREQVAKVKPLLPLALAEYQERLATKLREAVANLDEDRIRQELGVFAAKIDVEEELARLVTHLDEVERVLKKGGAVGKRLDFLMQELNREANTLASKSVSADVTAIALELKLLIEQMREQVQNLE
ncbi:MAG TPA: YicC/YloC family endoribonuclease [Rhodocyclaceae bacterium]|jgi:uncharacterized protein (TIGR00255 family)